MKKLTALFLAASVIAASLPLTAFAQSEKGRTERIRTSAELVSLAEKCTFDGYSMGLDVELEGDIDLGGVNFTGIPYFCGTDILSAAAKEKRL